MRLAETKISHRAEKMMKAANNLSISDYGYAVLTETENQPCSCSQFTRLYTPLPCCQVTDSLDIQQKPCFKTTSQIYLTWENMA